MKEYDVIILGAGLAGLSVAAVLGERAVVLEAEDRPGGLVRTECFNGYWFDHVIHLLYFDDNDTEKRIIRLSGNNIIPCKPTAWVETASGIVRFPFQMHLGGLKKAATIRSLRDLFRVTFSLSYSNFDNYEQMLLNTFGKSMCDIFLFPYNRKLWKRPLKTLAPTEFQWTITRPSIGKVLKGALIPYVNFSAYNSKGWYPHPPKNSPVRGMEVLTRILADRIVNLRLQHKVESIDTENRTVAARHNGRLSKFKFRDACVSTLPLPKVVTMVKQSPKELLKSCEHLVHNRVLSAAFSIHGPRPNGRGHWRYYADESVIFTRLIYMHEFDPYCAPESGWCLLAEVPEPAENPPGNSKEILSRIKADICRVKALPADCQIIDEHMIILDPAYVVFTTDNKKIMEQARFFLKNKGIIPLGRYGLWEYSSMGQVLRDGYSLGKKLHSLLLGIMPSNNLHITDIHSKQKNGISNVLD